MEFASLNKSYLILAGVMLIVVAFVVYMWLDARNLSESLSTETKPALEAKSAQGSDKPAAVQAQAKIMQQAKRRVGKKPLTRQRPKLPEPRETVERADPYQRPRSSSGTAAARLDNDRAKKGRTPPGEEPFSSNVASVSE